MNLCLTQRPESGCGVGVAYGPGILYQRLGNYANCERI